jgi:hypothetical protein
MEEELDQNKSLKQILENCNVSLFNWSGDPGTGGRASPPAKQSGPAPLQTDPHFSTHQVRPSHSLSRTELGQAFLHSAPYCHFQQGQN